MGDAVRALAIAFSFLTRVPTRIGDMSERDMRTASAWFPIVGAVVGLIVGGAYALAFQVLPSLLAAILAVALGIVFTGGFHEDGLADTMDSFLSGAVGDRALQIMRDSRVGTHGAIALVVSVAWRVVALASLAPTMGVVALVTAHSLSRAGSVVLIGLSPPARSDGLAKTMLGGTSPAATLFAVSTALLLGGVLAGAWVGPSVIVVALATAWARRAACRKIGGITGDVLGANQQLGEMSVLAVFAAASWLGATLWWL